VVGLFCLLCPGEKDWFAHISDPLTFLAQELSQLMSSAPGRYTPVMEKSLNPQQQQALLQFFTAAGVRFQ
jgi:hypothetical protein